MTSHLEIARIQVLEFKKDLLFNHHPRIKETNVLDKLTRVLALLREAQADLAEDAFEEADKFREREPQ